MRDVRGTALIETVLWLGLTAIFVSGFFEIIREGRTRLESIQRERLVYDGIR